MLATSTRPSPQARLQLTDLPDEMVLHIMRWLPLRDLAHCRQLSSRFNAIASDASLWRALCHVLYGCSRGDSKALTSKNHHNHHHNHNNHSHASKHWIDHVRTLRECAARYGGRLDHVDLAGNTVLHLEIAHKRPWTNNPKYLIDHGASLEARNHAGDTPLHTAVRKGDTITVTHLLARNCNADAENHVSLRPIHIAAQLGNEAMVLLLLKTGHASLATTTTSAIHLAAKHGHVEIVRMLIKHHAAALNARDEHRMTPLHLAVACGKLAVVRLLVDLGADISLRDAHDRTPFDIAVSLGLSYAVHLFNVVSMWTCAACSHYLPSGLPSKEDRVESAPLRLSDWSLRFW